MTVNLPDLEQLLANLFDAQGLRRFVANLFGSSLADQLPDVTTTKTNLVHACTVVMHRNGVVTEHLFAALIRERPQRKSEIEEVAGGKALDPAISAPMKVSPRTPDYVVKDTYDALRRDQELVREFLAKHMSLTRFIENLTSQNLEKLPEEVVSWVKKHAPQITNPRIRQALEGFGSVGASFKADANVGLTLAVLGLDPALKSIKQLKEFAEMTNAQLHQLALQQVGMHPSKDRR